MTLGPLALVALAAATHVYPDPAERYGEVVIDLRRPASWAREEHRARAEIAAFRGRADKRAEYADALAHLGGMQALAHKRAALDTWLAAYHACTEHFGPRHRSTANAAINLAGRCAERGRFAEAERYYGIAWHAYRRMGRDDLRDRAERFSDLGRLYEDAGRYDLALWCTHRAIQLHREDGRRPHEYIWNVRTVARLATRVGRLDVTRDALQLAESAAPDDPGVQLDKARYLVAAGDDRAAEPLLRDALAVARGWIIRQRAFEADFRVLLAGIVTRAGDPERGRFDLLTAIDAYERAGGPRSPDYIDAVAEYERLFPDDAVAVARHVAAIRGAAVDEDLTGPEPLVGEKP
ncbi:tetratricopeptide repeat protein [bacterium]|nr:tetratricopeptide repeat protein [bacterium]